MIDIIKKIIDENIKGSLIPAKQKDDAELIMNSCKVASDKSFKKENKTDEFYGFGKRLTIHNITIENPMVYIGKNFEFSINPDDKISENKDKNNYLPYLSTSYFHLSQYNKYQYLQWLANDRYALNSLDTFLVLYFRGLQHRAVAEEQDIKIILFELIKFFKAHYKNAYYYFKENFLNLIVYLIITCNETFNEEEQKILLDFVNEFKNIRNIILDNLEFVIIKIKNISLDVFINEYFEVDNRDRYLIKIFEEIKTNIFKDSKSKFFNFASSLFHKSYKKESLLFVAFKILLQENDIDIYDKKSFNFDWVEKPTIYSNYYLPSKYDKEYKLFALTLKLSLKVRKIFFEASEIVQEYEDGRVKLSYLKNGSKYISNGKSLNNAEKYSILPEKLKQYFDGIIIPKKRKLTKEELNSIPVEYNVNNERLTSIREDTHIVKNILTEIFYENEEIEEKILLQQETKITTIVKSSSNELDSKYLKFIEFLKQRDVWTEKELMNYCRENKLLLSNAISTINDYYDENYNDYLIEEDGDFYINSKLKS